MVGGRVIGEVFLPRQAHFARQFGAWARAGAIAKVPYRTGDFALAVDERALHVLRVGFWSGPGT
jgi:hypothetical protein